MASQKQVHSIVLDAGPILKNEPSISTLLTKCEKLFTVPSVLAEIKDENARSRLETMLLPFLTIRDPKPDSVKFVSDFSRRTGDKPALSTPDVQVLALAYELECEQNGGDWRLRNVPGQKKTNSPRRVKEASLAEKPKHTGRSLRETNASSDLPKVSSTEIPSENPGGAGDHSESNFVDPVDSDGVFKAVEGFLLQTSENDSVNGTTELQSEAVPDQPETDRTELESESESSNSEGWITPSNLKKQRNKDDNASTVPISEDKVLQVATITGDYAMQNVLLQIGLNLLSPSMQRIRNIRTYILRCHACFEKVKDMDKQFCPRCGNSTLTRVSCSTNAKGEYKLHLKKNMQWNHRGDRYSIPKPVPGAANGKVGQSRGGGKGGWGQELILTEDQKEYQRAMTGRGRKEPNPMDEDYLPGILTGERGRYGGRPKVGAGRNVNSKKRAG